MNHVNYFKDLFESLPDYGKIVLFRFLIKKVNELLTECGILKNDINSLNKEFRNVSIEQNEEYLDHIRKQEESIIEKFLKKSGEKHFATNFEDVRHERSPILLLSLVEPDILKQSKFTDNEIDIIKIITLEKLRQQRKFKEIIALDLLEKQSSDS